jgi:hypothetical protein
VDTGRVTIEAFERFMREVASGSLKRNAFAAWEVDLLLDLQQVRMERGRSEQLMRRYRQAARKYLERGADVPLKLSEYIAGVHRRRTDRKAA